MRYRLFLSMISCVLTINSFAFADSTLSSHELKNLAGCWAGTITYLDYSSNKPFSMPAKLRVADFNKTTTITGYLEYPEEPKANDADTFFLSADGRLFNQEPVKLKRSLGKDSLEIVTEILAIDGNDNKPALLRHTYLLSKNCYSVKKQVQFVGTQTWLLRNEYRFGRVAPCGSGEESKK
ncbi:MAG: hypothetical protein JWQ27_2161 [Ferruginibacter sp.]|nr:hypothetical protein [Ferruginibacter sp.]